MTKERSLAYFMSISRLYMKMTDSRENLVDDAEIELFIGSLDISSLSSLRNSHEPACKTT